MRNEDLLWVYEYPMRLKSVSRWLEDYYHQFSSFSCLLSPIFYEGIGDLLNMLSLWDIQFLFLIGKLCMRTKHFSSWIWGCSLPFVPFELELIGWDEDHKHAPATSTHIRTLHLHLHHIYALHLKKRRAKSMYSPSKITTF